MSNVIDFLNPEPEPAETAVVNTKALDLVPSTVSKHIIEPHLRLMAHRQHGCIISPEALMQYELELNEIIEKVQNNDLSDMDAILASQAISLNNSYCSFAQQADSLIYEGHGDEAEKVLNMALRCVDKSMKAIGQIQRSKKKPKSAQIFIKTMNQLNQQVNN